MKVAILGARNPLPHKVPYCLERSHVCTVGLGVALMMASVARAEPPLPGAEGPFLGTGPGTPKTEPTLPGLQIYPILLGTEAPPAGVPEPGWHIVPSLGVQVLATDNANTGASGRRGDVITTINPGIQITVNTSHLAGAVSYSPTAQFYAEESNQNRVNHAFNGDLLTTIIDDTLYLDLRGYGAVEPAGGGFTPLNNPFAPQNPVPVNRHNQIQTLDFQASPYLLHRFGSFATMQVGYSYGYLEQTGNAVFLPEATQPFFTPQTTISNEGYAVVRTGEDFGRLNFELHLDATSYSGTSVLAGGHNDFATIQASYAVTRTVTALVESGYENQRYGGTQPLSIHDIIWGVGIRVQPDPQSTIIVRYGHRNGFNSASVDAGVNIGARTRVFASYSDELGTIDLLGADLLATTSLDALGNPVNTDTGAPLIAPFGGGLLATQSGLSRIKRGTVGITQTWPRDTVTLSLFYDDITPITTIPGTASFPQQGFSGGPSWSHNLTRDTVLTLSVQYGRTESSVAGSGDVYTATAALNHLFTPTLVGSLEYVFNRSGAVPSDRAVQNIVIATLTKTF